MRPEDIRKLVGGYATGTLTAEERRTLLEAALSDQDLFNELARDQALKDLLEDPLARRRLLDAVEERTSLAEVLRAWLGRPAAWTVAGGLAAAVVVVAVLLRPPAAPPVPEPVLTAKLEAPPGGAPPPAAELASERAASVGTPELRDSAASEISAQPEAANRSLAATEADALAAPIPYRLLRADAAEDFAEVAFATVFGQDDRIRVVFEPAQSGRLRVVSSSSQTLLDLDLESGTTVPLDVPPGETRLTGAFRAIPFEIRIPRRP